MLTLTEVSTICVVVMTSKWVISLHLIVLKKKQTEFNTINWQDTTHFHSDDDSEQYLINMPVGMTFTQESLKLYYIKLYLILYKTSI